MFPNPGASHHRHDKHLLMLPAESHWFSEEEAPTKGLLHLIRRRDWDACKYRILTYPWDAKFQDRSGNNSTCLHLTCLYRAPREVLEMLVDANPRALLAQDAEGWTPIHLCLLYGVDEDTTIMLIRRGGKQAVSMQSRFVGSPLHLACRHGCSLKILKELVSANCSMAECPNETGLKPLAFVWNNFVRNPENADIMKKLRLTGKWTQEDIVDNRNVEDLMDRVRVLLDAVNQQGTSYPDERDDDDPSIFTHELIKFQEKLGDMSHFIPLAIRLFPDDVKQVDGDGNAALHLAARTPAMVPKPHDYCRYHMPSDDPLIVLVEAYPEAVKLANHLGEIPLMLALTSGRRTWSSGVSSLVQQEPEVLMKYDKSSLLYPFQLASAYPADEEDESTTTILELLLACPHALQ
jgi:hypothetical protein